MTIPALNRQPAVQPRRAVAKPGAVARPDAVAPKAQAPRAAAAPAVRAQAQAAPAAKPKKFADLASYQAFVSTSEATKLPAARAAVASAEGEAAQAHRALAAKKREVNHDGLKAALDRAEQALEKATYPLRPQAAEKRAEAGRVSGEAGELAKQISRAQQQIAQAEANKAARSRDFWTDDSEYTGWDAVFDGLGAIGDASTIKAAKARINTLIEQKVALEMKATTLIAEATALHNQQADAGTIAAPKKARDDAQAAFDAAVAAEAPEQRAADRADAGVAAAKGELARLEGVKKELTDYSKQFGFFTRVKLTFTNWGWKKELDAFWKQKGL